MRAESDARSRGQAPAPRVGTTRRAHFAADHAALRRRLDGYQIARTAATIVAAPYLLFRKLRKVARNPRAHANELAPARWNCPIVSGRNRADHRGARIGPHVVLVGKGFGELRLVARIDAELRARRPDITTTWCGQVQEFFDGAAALHPHQPTAPIPFDFAPAVTRWLAHLQPDVVVFVEQFWRPSLVLGCASAGIRLVAVNAIFREGKVPAAEFGPLDRVEARRILGSFSAVYFQSDEQAQLASASLPWTLDRAVTGNLKLNLEAEAIDPVRACGLHSWLERRGRRPLFAAGSTRRGDEAFVLEAFAAVRRSVPCSLLLAPRQMERIAEVHRAIDDAGFTANARSRPSAHTDVFLLDTVGELAAAYPEAVAAFLGGTLRHRGQNFAEPLLHGLPVSFGPAHVYLATEQRACIAAGLAAEVKTPGQLAEHWKRVIEESPRRDAFAARAARFLADHRESLRRTVEMILDHTMASGDWTGGDGMARRGHAIR